MDLTRLYNLTTPELRAEAERLGVRDTYAMSRGQLIHAIRNQVGGAPPEGLFGKMLGFAKWALQQPRKEEGEEAADSGRPHEAPVPSMTGLGAGPAGVAGSTAESAQVSVPASAPASASAAVSAVPPASDSGPPTAAEVARVSAPAPESVSDPVFSSTGVNDSASGMGSDRAIGIPSEPDSAPQSGPPSRPPVGVFSQSASLFEEPFPTRTMARILADQGHFKRSLAIYAHLLQGKPEDHDLRDEAEEVRSQSRARRPQVH